MTLPAHPFLRPLPEELSELSELALDLRWTWSHAADRLWESVAPEIWQWTGNPWLVLQSVSQRRLETLAKDPDSIAELARLAEARSEYQDAPTWFADVHAKEGGCIAYFSMEYGLAEALPLYSGGLGILAGDHLKSASDLGVPIVAVGLLYQEGYFRQMLDTDGAQLEFYPHNVPSSLPVTPVRDADGAWLSVPIELPGRRLLLRVWRAQVGRVPLYLLDSNDAMNSAADHPDSGLAQVLARINASSSESSPRRQWRRSWMNLGPRTRSCLESGSYWSLATSLSLFPQKRLIGCVQGDRQAGRVRDARIDLGWH